MVDSTETTAKLVLCPYCGHAQHGGDRCQVCSGLFEPLSRRATQLAMGPWQIRDKHNPFRPGCCYDIVKKMAAAGKIKSTTVMRGPTTRQFWSIARNVPGISHLIGYCHECGFHVSPSDAKCGDCGAVFVEHRQRNQLGLTYKNDDEARLGQQILDAEIKGEPIPARAMPGPTKRTRPRPAKSGDLLDEVLDLSGDITPGPAPVAKPGMAPPTPKPVDFISPPPTGGMQPMQPTSAFDIDPTKPLPDDDGISPMVLMLIAANIIAIAVIVVFVLLNR